VLSYTVFLLPQRNKAFSYPAKKIGEQALWAGEARLNDFKGINRPLAD
jgi:hypothetical protein